MIDYLLNDGFVHEAMTEFTRSYNMKDVLLDIGAAWEKVDGPHIHKCFEKLINPQDYVTKYNEKHTTNAQWDGVNFPGFTEPGNDNSAAERVEKIKEIVSKLHNKITALPENRRVTIDTDSVTEAIDYDPNDDLGDTSDLIQRGFLGQREAEGLESEENDLDPHISHNIHETLKALANIQVKFRTEHFKSKEEADKASTHLKALQEIFLGMNDPTASTIHTPPRASSRATSPEPPLAMDVSLDEMAFVHVTLDENPAASPSASPSA